MEQALAKKEVGIEQVRRAEALDRSPEMAAVAAAASAKAQIEARFLVALSRPRDFDKARERLLAACSRPGFSDRAIYAKPQGKRKNEDTGAWEETFIYGLSIRFAEEAVRDYGNIHVQTAVIYDDEERTVIAGSAVDLETNATLEDSVIVTKRVERRGEYKNPTAPPKGRKVLGTRLNTKGDQVFVVEATDDEMVMKTAAAKSKLIRTLSLRLLPGDLLEEARAACDATTTEETKEDLPKKRENMLKRFADHKIPAKAVGEYLGHDPMQASADEMRELGHVLNGIEDKNTSWAEALDAKRDARAPVAPEVPTSAKTVDVKASPAKAEEKASTSTTTSPAEKTKAQAELDVVTKENPSSEPAIGTSDFSLWLRARLREAKTVKHLNQLSMRKGQCPEADWPAVLEDYTTRKNELTKE